MKYVIVTGATSLIGVHVVEELLQKGYFVYAIVRKSTENLRRFPKNKKLKIIKLDMEHYNDLDKYVEHRIDFIFHFAWNGAREPARNNPYIQINNYYNTLKLIDSARKLNVMGFIGSGSQAEYGMCEGMIDESFNCNPVTEYGKAKLKVYQKLHQEFEKGFFRYYWVRIFSVYGRYDYSKTLVMTCIDKMKKDQQIVLNNGNQMWDYLYVKDAACGLISLMEKGKESGIYNLASGTSQKLIDYIKDIKNQMGSQSEIVCNITKTQNKVQEGYWPSVKKICKMTGWEPQYSFKQGIDEMIN